MTDVETRLCRMAAAIETRGGDAHVVKTLRQVASQIALGVADPQLVESTIAVGAETMATMLEGAA